MFPPNLTLPPSLSFTTSFPSLPPSSPSVNPSFPSPSSSHRSSSLLRSPPTSLPPFIPSLTSLLPPYLPSPHLLPSFPSSPPSLPYPHILHSFPSHPPFLPLTSSHPYPHILPPSLPVNDKIRPPWIWDTSRFENSYWSINRNFMMKYMYVYVTILFINLYIK